MFSPSHAAKSIPAVGRVWVILVRAKNNGPDKLASTDGSLRLRGYQNRQWQGC